MKRIGILSVALGAMLTVACAGDGRNDEANRPASDTAAVGTAGEREADRNVSAGARRWAEDLAQGNMAEIKLGEMASTRAQNADVKAFARMLVQDHTKASDELKQIITKHNVMPPAELSEDGRQTSERLSKLQTTEFDREYVKAMVDKHEKTLDHLEERVDKEGDDANPRFTPKKNDNAFEMQLNEFAAKTAPVVNRHLEHAKQLDQKLGCRTTN
jgi:putative membrane protein